MARSFKTWIVLTAVLATLAQPALAGGRNNRLGSVRSGNSRTTTFQPLTRRVSQPFQPAPRTGSIQQIDNSRFASPRTGNLGNNLQNVVPRNNNANLNLVNRNRTRVTLPTPNLQLSPSPINRIRDGVGTISPIARPPFRPGRRDESPVDPAARLRDREPVTRPDSNDGANDGGRPVSPVDPAARLRDREPVTRPDSNDGANDGGRPVSPVDPAARLRDREPVTRPDSNGRPNPGNDSGSNPSPDEAPADGSTDTPPPAVVPPDELGDPGVPDAEPIDNPPVDEEPAEDTTVSDTGTLVTDLLSQIIGSGGAAPSAPVGFPSVDPGIQESLANFMEDPPIVGAAVEPTPEAATETETTDLEITDVRLVDAGSLAQDVGPRYRIVCRNNGSVELSKFHVTVLVDLGKKLTEKAEIVTLEAVGMLPGGTQTVDVRLPVSVLKMISNDSKAKPFEMFVAFADSDERFAETNEENNILALTRDAIKPLKVDAETERAAADQAKPKTTEETK